MNKNIKQVYLSEKNLNPITKRLDEFHHKNFRLPITKFT